MSHSITSLILLILFCVSIPGLLLPTLTLAFTTSLQVSDATKQNPKEAGGGIFSKINLNEGLTSGHEEITRQSMIDVRKLLKENLHIDPASQLPSLIEDLGSKIRGTIGGQATNELIKGNYCTDMPKAPTAEFNIVDYWYVDGQSKDWHNDPDTQWAHFLRNYTPTGLVSAKKSCIEARNRILWASKIAVLEWQEGRKERAAFLIGHVTHTLQDSFAPAHTRRWGKDKNFDLKDLCYYGADKKAQLTKTGKQNSACFHETVDLVGDSVWIRTRQQLNDTLNNFPGEYASICDIALKAILTSESVRRACMKSEARLAREATTHYLYIMAQDIAEHRKTKIRYNDEEINKLADKLMKQLFEGTVDIPGLKTKMPSGVMRCENLK